VFKGSEGSWDVVKDRAGRNPKAVRPSEINHGNIAPTVQPLGITCDYAEHTAVISFAGLRRLGFGGGERDQAGRILLAALGLVALAEQDERGYSLRSRCDLVCDGRAPLELVHADGSVDHLEIDREEARRLYSEAYAAALKAGFELAREPIQLEPQDKLVAIVRRSQQLALEGEGGEAGEPI
jgi:CRISPR-associated protein Csb1